MDGHVIHKMFTLLYNKLKMNNFRDISLVKESQMAGINFTSMITIAFGRCFF